MFCVCSTHFGISFANSRYFLSLEPVDTDEETLAVVVKAIKEEGIGGFANEEEKMTPILS
jgi:hypothetical protein